MTNPSSQNELEKKLLNGELWDEFCDRMKLAGQVILRDSTPDDLFNRAEGYRYISRLLRAGLESYIESSDPHFPRFYQLANDIVKIGNDNPDNIYHNANLDGRLNYKIIGKRGTVSYISFGTKAGSYATTGEMVPTGQIEANDLQVDEDGNFEIIVSSTPQSGNWLPMREDTSIMVVRQTFHNRSEEQAAEFTIECLNKEFDNQLQPAVFAEKLLQTTDFVTGTANLFVDWMDEYAAHINQLPSDDQLRCQRAGGDANIHYLQSYWKLANDEALVIHAKTIPDCKMWNFQLSNYWMESLDYQNYKISVNKFTAHYEPDGSVIIVVAHLDPGDKYPNWLTTTGHDQGGMLFRWIESKQHPPVDCKVVKFDEL